MLGIIPAAGAGSRIQPLAFSKELLPVGGRLDGAIERPRAVSEYLVDRMRIAGANKLCFVIGAGKWDILEYYSHIEGASAFFVVQPSPAGLCDAMFCAAPVVAAEDSVGIGLPDTIWFPEDGLKMLPDDELSFLLFPVEHPQFFDAVVTDCSGQVREIQVKQHDWRSHWVWGAGIAQCAARRSGLPTTPAPQSRRARPRPACAAPADKSPAAPRAATKSPR